MDEVLKIAFSKKKSVIKKENNPKPKKELKKKMIIKPDLHYQSNEIQTTL